LPKLRLERCSTEVKGNGAEVAEIPGEAKPDMLHDWVGLVVSRHSLVMGFHVNKSFFFFTYECKEIYIPF
jgi:hypothetical protein